MARNLFCKNKTFVFIILTILIIVGSVAFVSRVFSYNDTITHPSLTDNVAKIYNTNFDRKLSDEEISWLKDGSIKEDLAPRWLNHFYNPENGTGLGSMMHSKAWAQSPNYQSLAAVFSGGNQTWQKAIDSYAKGKDQEAFYALGHVLHLLEDATVPAHTRIDEHAKGDPYEKWVADKIGTEIDFNVTPNPISNLNMAFGNLAVYSSNNFLSEDTIKTELLVGKNIQKEIKGKFIDCLEGKIEGQSFCLISYNISNTGKTKYIIDSPIVHSDYFSLLAPKAVSYGAGVIKLFFDEAEKAKQAYEQKSWWDKLRESANQLFSSFSGSLYAGISLEGSAPSDASGASGSEAPEVVSIVPVLVPAPISVPLPANTVEAREKIVVNLPPGTVVAEEKLGGNIAEEIIPQDAKIPSAIVEETIPGQAKLPATSPAPLTFLPGMGGPTPTPSPSSNEPDTTAPETTITSAPTASVATTSATFIFTSSESGSTFGCQLDGAATSSCVSPQEYNNLSEASHNFKVSATDAAGNSDLTPAEYSWAVDLAAPQLSSIASTPGRTSALISWTASEAGVFQIEYGTSTSYGLASATTSAVSLNINTLTASTTYHFRILAQDALGNATSTDDNNFTTTSQAENVVISEVQIGGANATDEFIELYNPTSGDISLLDWRLTKKSASGATTNNLLTNFPDKIIISHGYFLIAHPTDYDGGVPADAVYSTTASLAENNTLILYSDAGDTIVDLVGLGTASSSETATINNPGNHQSIERKAVATSTTALLVNGVHQWQGNGYDSDNNFQDFVLQTSPNPQNSLMLTEPRTSLPGLMTTSAWPTWQGNLARTGLSSVNSLATSTMGIKWSVATSSSAGFTSRPVLDNENNVYIGMANGLAKFSASDGSLLWRYATSSAVMVSPLITDDGTIYFRGGGGLFAISSSGQLKWVYYLPGTAAVNAALAILSDGTIITQSAEKVYAINQDATLKWIFDPDPEMRSSDSITASVIDALDNIYIAIDNLIYFISSAGTQRWEPKNLGPCSSMALDNSNNILYFTTSPAQFQGSIYALSAVDGSTLWFNDSGRGDRASWAPAIDSSSNVYFLVFFGASGGRRLDVYTAASSSLWSINPATINLAAPIVTSDGKIYLVDDKTLKIFDAVDGALLGSFSTSDNQTLYNYFGAVGADGVVYTANGTTLFAIGNGG